MLRLLLAILAISTGAPFVRWAAPHAAVGDAVAIGALRVSLASLLLFAAGWRELGALRRIREWRWVVLAGALLAVHFGSWIVSLSFTSTAASVALVCTNPIFAALFGTFLGDRVSSREIGGIAIAAVGCAVLAGGDWRAANSDTLASVTALRGNRWDALIGDGLALVGAASAAGYLVVGRRLRASLPLLPYLGVVNAIAGGTLLVAALVLGSDLAGQAPHFYVACAGAALIASFVGHSLLNAAVRTTPTHLVALAVLGEPIGSSLITWAAFGEQPPLHAVAGGAVVLTGIAVGFVKAQAPGA